jgi:hypothetical protein
MSHPSDREIALLGSGDLHFWRKAGLALHLNRCEDCRARLESYRADRESIRILTQNLPDGLNWDRLSAEMTANIRVGFAAGECVAPREKAWSMPVAWRVSLAGAGFACLLIAAWWVNMPKGETAALGKAVTAIMHGREWQIRNGLVGEDSGSLVEASSAGIELRENGYRLGLLREGTRPASVTLSLQGAARARYIDSDTGQVTITSVYAE